MDAGSAGRRRLILGGTALVRTTPRRGADYPVRRRWKQVVVDEERTATPVVPTMSHRSARLAAR